MDKVEQQNLREVNIKKRFKTEDTGLRRPHNLLIEGLPGTGKTATVRAWAASKGYKIVDFDAKSEYLPNAVAGKLAVVMKNPPAKSKNEIAQEIGSGNLSNETTYALQHIFSDTLKGLEDSPEDDNYKYIVFIDEFNRQPNQAIRSALMEFIEVLCDATHTINLQKKILFTIAAENPSGSYIDFTTMLSAAEKNRFDTKLINMNGDPKETLSY